MIIKTKNPDFIYELELIEELVNYMDDLKEDVDFIFNDSSVEIPDKYLTEIYVNVEYRINWHLYQQTQILPEEVKDSKRCTNFLRRLKKKLEGA